MYIDVDLVAEIFTFLYFGLIVAFIARWVTDILDIYGMKAMKKESNFMIIGKNIMNEYGLNPVEVYEQNSKLFDLSEDEEIEDRATYLYNMYKKFFK